MDFIWVLLIIGAIWYFSKKSRTQNVSQAPAKPDEVEKPRNYTEEEVLSFQTNFEKRLDEQVDFPDGIRFTPVYIYKNLMRKWFSELSSKYRYDDQMIQKLRNDWVDYMYLLEKASTANYLWFETEGDRAEEYHQNVMNYTRKIFALEDAFANYSGSENHKELERVRSLQDKINKRGEMAPEGKVYWLEELVDDKEVKSE